MLTGSIIAIVQQLLVQRIAGRASGPGSSGGGKGEIVVKPVEGT